jgi:ligand-binding sensor domain-containing protein
MKRVLLILLGVLAAQGLSAQEYAFTPYGPDRGVPRDIVTDIVQDHRGFVWVGLARSGVRRMDGRNAVMLRSPHFPLSRDVFALAVDEDRHLFVGGNAGVVAVLLDDNAADSVDRVLSELLREVPAPVRRLELRAPRILYMESSAGAWEMNLRDSSLVRVPLRPPRHGALAADLQEDVVRDVATDCLKRRWIATDRGLLLKDETRSWRFDSSNGLPVEDVHSVMVDREANVWCGTSRGVYMHVPSRVTNYSAGASLPEDMGSVHCVIETSDRSVCMGGEGGLLRFFDGPVRRITMRDGLPSNTVRALLELPNGDLLIGTDNGLAVWDGETVTAPPPQLTLPGPRVTALLQARDRSYWVATSGGLLHWDGKSTRVLTRADGLPANHVLAITEDAYGLLWVGTTAGLANVTSRYDISTVLGHQLLHLPVRALYADDKDRLWIGTDGAGVFVHSGGRSVQLTRDDGLAGDAIGSIIADNHGSLYFGTGGGISVLPRANIQYLMPVDSANMYHHRRSHVFAHLPFLRATAMHTLGPSTDFLTREYARGAVMRDGSGRLWFTSTPGVSCYNPPRPMGHGYWQPPLCRPALEDGDPAVPFTIHVAALCINDTCTAQRGHIDLGTDDTVLRLRLLLPTFRNPGQLRYLYQLRGMEYSWHASTDGEILYTGLKPGSYVLTVQAALGEGVWTRRAWLLEVDVAAPFTETPWFWVLLIVIAGIVGYLAQQQRHAWLLARERRRAKRDSGDMFYNPN